MRRAFLVGAVVASVAGGGAALAQPYGAKYDPSAPPGFCTHQTRQFQVTVTNTGTLTWSAGGATPFRLSYHWYKAGVLVTPDGLRTALPRDIAPGQGVTLTASVQAPATSGSYTLEWDMVQETVPVTYFSSKGVPTANQTVGFLSNIVCLGGVSTLLPQITSTTNIISPGGVLLAVGHFFGSSGTAKLTFQTGPMSEVPLTILAWQDTFIGALVPDGISGVTDQGVNLIVTRAADAAQASHPLVFFATRDSHWLRGDDVQVDCSPNSWRDRCNGVGDDVINCTVDFDVEGIATLEATHQTGSPLGMIGSDVISVDLKNGWALSDMLTSETEHLLGVDGFVPGTAKATVSANWYAGDWCHPARYYVDLTADGPLGVPWK